MEEGFSYLMFAFAALLLLYGLMMMATGDYKMIPHWQARSVKPTKAYARRLGLIIVICAGAPALGGLVGLFAGPGIGAIVMVAALVFCLWLATKLIKDVSG